MGEKSRALVKALFQLLYENEGCGYWYEPYTQYLTLWNKISQNLASLEGNSQKNSNLTEFSDHF